MQEFFIDYGLWLLIALLVVIVIVFLLSRGKSAGAEPAEAETLAGMPPPERVTAASTVEPEIVGDMASIAPPEPAAAPPPVAPEPVSVASAPVVADTPAPVDLAPPPPEPIPVSPAVVAPAEQPAPGAPAGTGQDNLLQLKGVGPKLNTLLIELGVTRFAQIAGWTDADIAAIDPKLGAFRGRPVRDQWIDQARYLAAGDIAGYEAKYGKL